MKRLELPRKSKLESRSEYLDRVYSQNKDKIDTAYHAYIGTGSAINTDFIKRSFKNLVNEYIEEGYTLNQAAKKVLHKDMFTPVSERFQNNVYKAIKGERDVYKEFRNLTRNDKGQFTAIDMNNFHYEGRKIVDSTEYSIYKYNEIYIYLTQSPKGSNQQSVSISKENKF